LRGTRVRTALAISPARTTVFDMPALTKARKPARKVTAKKIPSPKTFGEWAKSVAGMVKNAPRDLSTREGFGN
jgi:hypothetical protein